MKSKNACQNWSQGGGEGGTPLAHGHILRFQIPSSPLKYDMRPQVYTVYPFFSWSPNFGVWAIFAIRGFLICADFRFFLNCICGFRGDIIFTDRGPTVKIRWPKKKCIQYARNILIFFWEFDYSVVKLLF